MSYALQRGQQWITAPEGEGPTSWPIPPVIAISSDAADAWLAPDLDTALERSALLRMCWGLATQVRAIR